MGRRISLDLAISYHTFWISRPLPDGLERAIIESIIDQLKNIPQIEHSRHHSPTNFVVHLIAGFIAYSHQAGATAMKPLPLCALNRRFLLSGNQASCWKNIGGLFVFHHINGLENTNRIQSYAKNNANDPVERRGRMILDHP